MPTSSSLADDSLTIAQDVAPFHYRHLGSFAFIGADNAVLEMPLHQKKPSAFSGFLTGLLWKGMESYEQISLKVRSTCLLLDTRYYLSSVVGDLTHELVCE